MTKVWNKVTTAIQIVIGYLLKEDGYYLLKEDGGKIIIEPTQPGASWNKLSKSTSDLWLKVSSATLKTWNKII